MKTKEWALLTGASSGFGVDYAHILGERGVNLVLTARRVDRLEELKNEVISKYGVEVKIIPADLSQTEDVQKLFNETEGQGTHISYLINNAGFGVYGDFLDTDWESTQKMLMVDIMALTQLTKVFGDAMKKRKSGNILLVGSIGAYQPCPTYAAYGAAKAYVMNFGEALNSELRGSGVKVAVLNPGVTATEFLKVAGQKPTAYQRLAMMKSRPVAEVGVKAMLAGTPSIVPGFFNKIMIWSSKLLPRVVQTRVAHMLMN
ncbi:MAG: SDR family oxidoreductase [Deltaproteobacteria bacterium]|nr:MAG: SDR family oxidoreductase [Deltaproteobacteria bacterium]TNF29839.1 MAG: SDR family oxidoreductase [Deltaproteobacteria bacterium]